MFLQGYLVMNETMKENEDLLEAPKESITYEEVIQEIPNIIRTLFKEYPEVLNVKICNEFAIDILTAMDQGLYEVITNSFNEIAYYGGCYAYIHKFEENIIREHKNELTSFEGLHFLTPQVYMYQKPNDESLTYELYGWAGSVLNNQWLGRVQFNPFKKDDDSLLAEIMLSDLIAAAEKNEIISLIMNILKNTTKVADNEKTIFINHFNVSTTNTYVIENVAVQAK
ncbi:hypothetical protein ACOQFO_16650 [Ureibacillus sp. MALMAid1270]|uniref:hypothetical protein n=1 Tax=Ureibacillus sp. MALMAid1270 TaxID=3411629 RepID=UPI003BA7822C